MKTIKAKQNEAQNTLENILTMYGFLNRVKYYLD